MPAGRGPHMRSELGRGVSFINDLYIDDADVLATCSPHARSPCAPSDTKDDTCTCCGILRGILATCKGCPTLFRSGR